MQKLALASAISAFSTAFTSPAFATDWTPNHILYTSVATAAANSITVQAGTTVSVYYVNDATAGTASDPSKTPPYQQPVSLVRSGNWIINTVTGYFSGEI